MNRFSRLIFVNLRRHRIRTAISIAGIGFGVAAMLMIVSIVLGAIGMFQGILAKESNYVGFEKTVSDLFFSSVSLDQIQALRALPQVERIDPMLVGIVSSPDHPIITCFGLGREDPRIRDAIWVRGNAAQFGTEPDTVYLGMRAAEFLNARLGERVSIGSGTFIVGGILQTENGFEDGGVFMPLPLAQAYFHRENIVSVATVKLKRDQDGPAFKKAVEATSHTLVALQSEEFNRSYSQFRILHLTSWAVGICSLLLGGMGVANTMLMSVFSRIREIAILRVCGFSKGQIVGLVFGEAGIVAGIGAGVGFTIGLSGLAVMNSLPQLQGYVRADVRLDIVAAILCTAFVTALGGALYPAWFASAIEPADALRFE